MLLLAFGILTTQAHGALITNGSFESACINPGASFTTHFPGDTCITGWTVIVEDIHYVGTFWVASDGSRSLDLDGNTGSAGGIEQTFSTLPGMKYVVSFDMAGNPGNAPTIKPMRVSADGQFQDFTFDITGRSFSNMGWTPHIWSFIADDTSATLEFRSLTTFQGWGPALDNVSVTALITTCSGLEATIIGTEGPDLLRGTAGNDVIAGLGGDDVIYGLGGDDILCGGAGNDVLLGGSGNDRLFGGAGRDALFGEAGNDQLFGQGGNDYLNGGGGDDVLNGGSGIDVCDGGPHSAGDTAHTSCEPALVLNVP